MPCLLIPDPLNASGVLLGIVNAVVLEQGDLATLAGASLRATAVAAAFFGLRQAYARLRRRHAIGLGDVKPAAVACPLFGGSGGSWDDQGVPSSKIPLAFEMHLMVQNM